jgi:cytochrome c553
MSEEALLTAMTKYKEMWQKKTYNKKEKGMAKSAGRLSDEEMKAVVAFITSQLSREGE